MAEPRRTKTTDPGDLKGVRILVVEARFYDDIAEELLKGATAVLDAAGAVYDILTVPGSLEIPPAITIAAVIMSGTAHPVVKKIQSPGPRRSRNIQTVADLSSASFNSSVMPASTPLHSTAMSGAVS